MRLIYKLPRVERRPFGSSEESESLVDTLTADGSSINPSSLSNLSGVEIQQLADLQELSLSEMEMEEQEIIIESGLEDSMKSEMIEEEIVETEIGAEEVEIETERSHSPEEILPDVKAKASVPPLRPLTIAPKPAKVPISVKPVPGQQLLFLHGAGTGQTIKLVSPQGQELGTIGRPVTIKSTMKTLTPQGNISLIQPKQVVMKKLVTPTQKTVASKPIAFTNKGNIMFVQKSDGGQLKIVQNPGSTVTTIPSPTKTITLQQAQEMGLLSGAKIIPQSTSTPKHTVILNKAPTKTIKLVPQTPTKILPATQAATIAKAAPQRLFLKTSASTNQTVIPSGQIIQLTGTQAMASNQLHQINIPGKGMQYIKFVSNAGDANVSTSSNITTLKTIQTSGTPTSLVLSELKPAAVATSIAPKPIKPALMKPSVGNTVMVVPNFIQTQTTHPVSKVAIPNRHPPAPKVSQQPQASSTEIKASQSNNSVDPLDTIEANGIRPRKPCNCTKSQCLKLYCDCFANGEFCHLCNCMNCLNNIDNEDHRQRAIKACLERNPNAFRPKIGKSKDMTGDVAIRKHTKGCNCKRSGCLKNYCECYEAKIACSSNCKCIGCRNIEDSMDKKLRNSSSVDNGINSLEPLSKVLPIQKDTLPFRSRRASSGKQAINFITDEVIEATCQCLLTVSDNGESASQDVELTKSQIIKEFGRCLVEIIECSSSYNLN